MPGTERAAGHMEQEKMVHGQRENARFGSAVCSIPPNKLHVIARQMPHTSLGFIAPLGLVLSGLSLPSLILYLIE